MQEFDVTYDFQQSFKRSCRMGGRDVEKMKLLAIQWKKKKKKRRSKCGFNELQFLTGCGFSERTRTSHWALDIMSRGISGCTLPVMPLLCSEAHPHSIGHHSFTMTLGRKRKGKKDELSQSFVPQLRLVWPRLAEWEGEHHRGFHFAQELSSALWSSFFNVSPARHRSQRWSGKR